MPEKVKQYYWDTCVFIAHLAEEREAYGSVVDDIGQFLEESSQGECVIHCSTITIAEITRSNIKGDYDFDEFRQLWGGGIIPFSPDPNTMYIASELRSLIYTKTKGERRLHTVDAIHLASALTLTDVFGVEIDAFHTFDNGGKRDSSEGKKGLPLIGYHEWCEQCGDDPLARRIIDMVRTQPVHEQRKLM
jgi:predicted nucleic acid-binding protein